MHSRIHCVGTAALPTMHAVAGAKAVALAGSAIVLYRHNRMHYAGAAALPTMPARAAAKAGGEQQTPGLRRVQPGASLAAILSGGPKYRCGLPLHASLHLM